MGLFQSKPQGKKVHAQSPQGTYKPSSPNALSRSLHPAPSQGATVGGRRRKHKRTQKKRRRKKSRGRH